MLFAFVSQQWSDAACMMDTVIVINDLFAKEEITVWQELRTNENLSFLDFGKVVVCL